MCIVEMCICLSGLCDLRGCDRVARVKIDILKKYARRRSRDIASSCRAGFEELTMETFRLSLRGAWGFGGGFRELDTPRGSLNLRSSLVAE
jgi:hypothetical protein